MTNITTVTNKSNVVVFDIDSQGVVTQQLTDLPQDETLTNTLLEALYPGIKVAIANVPTGFLDGFEESAVANALVKINSHKVEYRLIGASGSAKDGKFYLVDADHAQAIAERFQFWPEAAIVYFGILVSPCRVMLDEPDLTVMVVEDRQLGTNDCRGWIRRSSFNKLKQNHDEQLLAKQVERLCKERAIPLESLEEDSYRMLAREAEPAIAGKRLSTHCLYQFRLAFEDMQAKGSFKVMEDDAAALIGADIILPVSSMKPELKVPKSLKSLFQKEGKRFRGRVVLGIRDVSEPRTYGSSYQLIENAPMESVELEILPEAMKQARRFTDALERGDYTELLEILCLDEIEFIQERAEMRMVEAALLADRKGTVGIANFPYISNQLNKTLARWAFRTATGGGLRLPGFALADDGYLVAHQAKVYSGSDWIPRDQAIVALDSLCGLCVRYPIRSLDDLLPLHHMGSAEVFVTLSDKLEKEGCRKEDAGAVAEQAATNQLWLKGIYVLHSETAKLNGGDFDFDGICVVEESRFPRFVHYCFANVHQAVHEEKNKVKAKTSWFNLPAVAMKARGNLIGRITDLKSSCIAAGELGLARELVPELQKALDSLKWNVQPKRDRIDAINSQVAHAPWLDYKWATSISDLPKHLSVRSGDRIGTIYNHVRKELPDLAESRAPISEFKMLVSGEEVKRTMYDECRFMNSVYAAVVGRSQERQDRLRADCDRAASELEEAKLDANRMLRNQKYTALRQAVRSRRMGDERRKTEMKAINTWVRLWAASKEENRMAWVQALLTVVCEGQGSGGILVNAFPQEFVDRLAQLSGSVAPQVVVPNLEGRSSRIDSDGRTFLIEPIEDGGGTKETFLFRKNKNGEIFLGAMD
jgi:hypothetical protein